MVLLSSSFLVRYWTGTASVAVPETVLGSVPGAGVGRGTGMSEEGGGRGAHTAVAVKTRMRTRTGD